MDALGGTAAVARMTGRTYRAAFNWRGFNAFPSNTYLVISTALANIGKQAPPRLWGMTSKARKRA
jgi:hypothetical protein